MTDARSTFPILSKLFLQNLPDMLKLELIFTLQVDNLENFLDLVLIDAALVGSNSKDKSMEVESVVCISLHQFKHALPLQLTETHITTEVVG